MLPLALILVALASLAAGYLLGLQKSQAQSRALLERAAKAEAEAQAAKGNQDALRTEFSELASRLLEEKGARLREEASSQLSGVLAPFKQNLEDLKATTARMHREESDGRASLENAVKSLTDSHQQFSLQANNLSLTLKGNSRAQGAWGEVVLARVLSASGLREGQEYVLQGKGLQLKSESGDSRLPDAVVFLPENRQVVIDSKASLSGYFKWAESKDENAQAEAAKELIQSLKAHIKGLGEKDYTQLEGLRAPEFTLMFVPLEPALGVALSREPELFAQAWEKRIVVVGPNTLFSTLKVIDQIWGQERRNKNAEEIAKRGGLLYDKLVGFVEDLGRAKAAMRQALEAQDAAHAKLVDGRGNVISQAQELKSLGAKATKALPPAWVEAAGEESSIH